MADNYDVAVSFVAADEPLANGLRDALQPPLNVFVYPKRQEELVGKDGIEAFRDVFRHRSKIVVLLFREPWGKTIWTRVEKTAIEEFCLEEGWEHLVFVRLDQSAVPKWVPKPHLYLDLRTFGLSDLVGAIKARIMELGVTIPPPSAAEHAVALQRKEKFDEETHTLLGRGGFNEAVAALLESIAAVAKDVVVRTGWELRTGPGYYVRGFIISGKGKTLHLVGHNSFDGSAREVYLEITAFDREWPIAEPGKNYHVFPDDLESRRGVGRAHLRRLPEVGWCWEFGGQVRPTRDAAEAFVELFLDRIAGAKR